jgi:hypothetical protein
MSGAGSQGAAGNGCFFQAREGHGHRFPKNRKPEWLISQKLQRAVPISLDSVLRPKIPHCDAEAQFLLFQLIADPLRKSGVGSPERAGNRGGSYGQDQQGSGSDRSVRPVVCGFEAGVEHGGSVGGRPDNLPCDHARRGDDALPHPPGNGLLWPIARRCWRSS